MPNKTSSRTNSYINIAMCMAAVGIGVTVIVKSFEKNKSPLSQISDQFNKGNDPITSNRETPSLIEQKSQPLGDWRSRATAIKENLPCIPQAVLSNLIFPLVEEGDDVLETILEDRSGERAMTFVNNNEFLRNNIHSEKGRDNIQKICLAHLPAAKKLIEREAELKAKGIYDEMLFNSIKQPLNVERTNALNNTPGFGI